MKTKFLIFRVAINKKSIFISNNYSKIIDMIINLVASLSLLKNKIIKTLLKKSC